MESNIEELISLKPFIGIVQPDKIHKDDQPVNPM